MKKPDQFFDAEFEDDHTQLATVPHTDLRAPQRSVSRRRSGRAPSGGAIPYPAPGMALIVTESTVMSVSATEIIFECDREIDFEESLLHGRVWHKHGPLRVRIDAQVIDFDLRSPR